MFKTTLQKMMDVKHEVMEAVLAAGGPSPTVQNAARLYFDHLDIAGLLLQNLEWLLQNLPKMAEQAAEQAAAEGTIKFPGPASDAPQA